MMNTEEAIKTLETSNLDCHPSSRAGESAKVLIASYRQQSKALAEVGPRLLDEMRQAADWQAVSARLIALLKSRKSSGWDHVVEATLKMIDDKSNIGGDGPQTKP